MQNICNFSHPFCQTNRWFSLFNSVKIFLPVCALDIFHINHSRLQKIELSNLSHQRFNLILFIDFCLINANFMKHRNTPLL